MPREMGVGLVNDARREPRREAWCAREPPRPGRGARGAAIQPGGDTGIAALPGPDVDYEDFLPRTRSISFSNRRTLM